MQIGSTGKQEQAVPRPRLTLPQRAARLLAVGASALVAVAAPAQESGRLAFQTPAATEDLRGRLRRSSLLVQADREQMNDPQELFAAANAEYGRLLGVLYAEGHYSGVIRVAIDGREVAQIPPLDIPQSIGRI